MTIITWGSIVQKSIEATRELEVSADIIDLRTLYPLDLDTIKESISKTNRVIIAHEDNLTGGFGAEIAETVDTCGAEIHAVTQLVGNGTSCPDLRTHGVVTAARNGIIGTLIEGGFFSY